MAFKYNGTEYTKFKYNGVYYNKVKYNGVYYGGGTEPSLEVATVVVENDSISVIEKAYSFTSIEEDDTNIFTQNQTGTIVVGLTEDKKYNAKVVGKFKAKLFNPAEINVSVKIKGGATLGHGTLSIPGTGEYVDVEVDLGNHEMQSTNWYSFHMLDSDHNNTDSEYQSNTLKVIFTEVLE